MINVALHDLKVGPEKTSDRLKGLERRKSCGCDFYTLIRFRFCAYLLYGVRVMCVGGHRPGVNKGVRAYE